MRKFTAKFGLTGWLLFIAVVAMGAKMSDNILLLGDKTGSDIEIQMGSGRLKWDDATQKMQFSNDDGASIKDIGSGGGGAAGVNLLENADFESGSPPANWTASAGTYIAETSNPGFDSQSGSWDAAATSQTLDSDFQSVPLGLENRSCNATIQIKYDTGSNGDYKLQVVANTAGLLAEKDIAVNSDWIKDALQFTCPTSDSVKIRITSTLDAGIILVDNATLGKTDFVNISQTTLVAKAKYVGATDCIWQSSGTVGDFPTDSDCNPITVDFSTIAVDTADNQLPDIDFDFLPAGTYLVSAEVPMSGDAASARRNFRITDGTTPGILCVHSSQETSTAAILTLPCSAVFTYTTGGARNFKMQGGSSAGNAQLYNIVARDFSWEVRKYPSADAEAITLETVGEHWEAHIAGGNFSLGASAQTAYIGLENANGVMEYLSGETAQVPCSGTNPSTGLTCAVGNEQLGIVIDIKTTGRYRVCGTFSHQYSGPNNGEDVKAVFQWVETSNTSQTIIAEGNARTQSGCSMNGTDASSCSMAHTNCGYFNFESAGQKTLRLMYEQTVSGTVVGNNLVADGATSLGQRKFHVAVDKLDQQMPTPVFTDLTDSLDNKVEHNFLSVSGDPTLFWFDLDETAGSWAVLNDKIGAVDSITDNGVGNITINWVGGTFATFGRCWGQSAVGNRLITSGNSGTSSVNVTITIASTAAAVDTDFTLFCYMETN